MPLLYIVVGFVGGYIVGTRTGILSAMRREASAVLDSVGKLSHVGALHNMEGLRLHQGNEKNGVKLLIKTRDPSALLAQQLEDIEDFYK